jgi:hypothetical protein
MKVDIGIQDILKNLSERGQLEWELAVKRAENAALQAALEGMDESPVED